MHAAAPNHLITQHHLLDLNDHEPNRDGLVFLRHLSESAPLPGFDEACRYALRVLHQRLGFGLWMVTRVVDDDWIVLAAEDRSYGVGPGTVLRWSDSFCNRMVRGAGPVIAPRADDIEAYRDAPIGDQLEIGAYIGAPLTLADGELFGTLCAIDPEPQPDDVRGNADLVLLLARLLATILAGELRAVDASRDAERARAEAATDPLTGLANRRAWDALAIIEEARRQRYGSPACVLTIDLDGLKAVNDTLGHDHGDELLRRAARVLRETARASDLVARIGGDEFAVLAVDTSPEEGERLRERLRRALAAEGIEASLGSASPTGRSGGSIAIALAESDQAMYADKRSRGSLAP